jgi:iron complex transport system substrate-binding protein
VTDGSDLAWKEDFLLHGEALGARARAEHLRRVYGQLVQDFRTGMGERLAATRVSVVRFLPEEVRVYGKASFVGTILEEAGLSRPAAQDVQITEERVALDHLGAIDGDMLFVMPSPPSEITGLSQWRALDAVQRGEVHSVGEWPWGLGSGAFAASLILGYLNRLFFEGGGEVACRCKPAERPA